MKNDLVDSTKDLEGFTVGITCRDGKTAGSTKAM